MAIPGYHGIQFVGICFMGTEGPFYANRHAGKGGTRQGLCHLIGEGAGVGGTELSQSGPFAHCPWGERGRLQPGRCAHPGVWMRQPLAILGEKEEDPRPEGSPAEMGQPRRNWPGCLRGVECAGSEQRALHSNPAQGKCQEEKPGRGWQRAGRSLGTPQPGAPGIAASRCSWQGAG